MGLKPLPDRDKLKEDYSLLQSSSFQVEVATRAVNCQLSTVNCQLSTELVLPGRDERELNS
jgi:hypothetical protein